MATNHLRSGGALALVLFLGVACGDDSALDHDARPTPDGEIAADAGPDVETWVQVDHLARPGIAEALLLSNGYLAGYNATAPSFAGVPSDTLDLVVGEAKTVLKAVYLGVCLINGNVPGLTATTGLKPAGMECEEIGAAMFSDGAGTVLEPTVAAAAQAYADVVFGQFEPDVMRIDTGADSGYLTLCGAGEGAPLLCGGRRLTDDSIDITYSYLLNGAASHLGVLPAQFNALVSDGVQYDSGAGNSQNSGNVTPPDPDNSNQFHPAVISAFPYSAPPL